LAVPLQVAGVKAPLLGRGWVKFDEPLWPTALLPELKKLGDKGQTATDGRPRIFNDLQFGGFVIHHAPRLRVFIDDRCALYGGDLLSQYDHARRFEPERLDHWQQQYGFRHALVKTGEPFDRHLAAHPRWAEVQRTKAAVLYRRR
jgi:hypothetical protein